MEIECRDHKKSANLMQKEKEYAQHQARYEVHLKIQDLRNRIDDLKGMKDGDKRAHQEEVNRLRTEIQSRLVNQSHPDLDEEMLIRIFCDIYDETPIIPREIGHPHFPRYIRELVYDCWHEDEMLMRQAAQMNSEADELEDEIYSLTDENARLQRRISELEKTLSSRRRVFEHEIQVKSQLLMELHQKLSALMVEYSNLMELKIKLEAILASLKKRLERYQGDKWLYLSQELIDIVKTMISQVHIEGWSMEQKRTLCKVIVGSIPRSKPAGKESALTVFWLDLGSPSRTKVDRTNTGPVSIKDCDPRGHWMLLENASFKTRKDQLMEQWIVKRYLPNNHTHSYTFPKEYKLYAETDVVLWAQGAPDAKHDPPFHIIVPHVHNWGEGYSIRSVLFDENDKEKATHIETPKKGFR